MSDQLLQAFQENRAAGRGCASPEDIFQAVAGHASARQTASLIEHTIRCGDCAQLWRLARDAYAAGEEPARPAPRERPVRWLRWSALGGAGLAAAAALLLVVVVRRPALENPERGSPETQILSTSARELPREAFLLRWVPAGPEARYRVQVTLPDLTELDSAAGLTSPEHLVPPGALEGVRSGTDVLWRVDAQLPDGRNVSSPPFRTRVR